MFESLGEKLTNAFKKFRSKGKLTEADVKAGMREIKLAPRSIRAAIPKAWHSVRPTAK